MIAPTDHVGPVGPSPPGDLLTGLLIARRAAMESLRDRSTALLGAFFSLVLPVVLVVTSIRPGAAGHDVAGVVLTGYLLLVGLLPTSAAVGSAAGQFAGEIEQGNLTPLLASPASNTAIFGGKVLGAVGPALLFALVAEVSYVGSLALLVPGSVGRLPLGLTLVMLGLVPGVALFAATLASLISSRVRTYNAAQQLAGFALLPVWALVGGASFVARDWGTWVLAAVLSGVVAIDAALVLLAAATWRREEVLARR
ncbi:MAG: type transport system permease protein [Thermomicrobiales bacterium]|nr:type transport system permease protein [Thermomicrobiales bacterium]